jgi:NADH-quinone oxidoreductase subunit I
MSERFRGLVGLHPEKCIVCYQCMKMCPTACLAITHKQEDKKKTLETFKYNMELCCFCGMCAQVCPTGAIVMTDIYEISVYDRKKLDINLLDAKKYDEWTHTSVK